MKAESLENMLRWLEVQESLSSLPIDGKKLTSDLRKQVNDVLSCIRARGKEVNPKNSIRIELDVFSKSVRGAERVTSSEARDMFALINKAIRTDGVSLGVVVSCLELLAEYSEMRARLAIDQRIITGLVGKLTRFRLEKMDVGYLEKAIAALRKLNVDEQILSILEGYLRTKKELSS